MKIVLIGGTGPIGSRLFQRFPPSRQEALGRRAAGSRAGQP